MSERHLAWMVETWGTLLTYTCASQRRAAIAEYVYHVDDEAHKDGRNRRAWGPLNEVQKGAWEQCKKRFQARAVKVYITRAQQAKP